MVEGRSVNSPAGLFEILNIWFYCGLFGEFHKESLNNFTQFNNDRIAQCMNIICATL